MDKRLKRILNDKTSGSSEIHQNLISYLQKISSDKQKLKEAINSALLKLNHFKIVKSTLEYLLLLIEKNQLEEVEKVIKEKLADAKKINQQIYLNSHSIIKDLKRVITLSNSGTVKYILNQMQKNDSLEEVVVLESRPKREGRKLADFLIKRNIKVVFIPDLMAAREIESCNAVFLGVDALCKDGSIVNKTGSKILALLAEENEIPVYVFSQSSKLISGNNYYYKEENSDEVWKKDNELLKIKNIYFEGVEAKLITKIFTEVIH